MVWAGVSRLYPKRTPAINHDPVLIESARQGDVAALEELLVRCQPDVNRFAVSVCATPEDAEDAVQETLWIIYQKIGALRTIGAFSTWLFRVVKHQCLRLDSVPEPSYEFNAYPAFTTQQVVAAIAVLPPLYQQVLLMRDVESLTAPEVAQTLGITVQAVKSRLHRARGLVRETLLPEMD